MSLGLDLYGSLCGTEIWNKERLACYVANGVAPNGMTLRCEGCSGMTDLVPCIDDQPSNPMGYQLPEIDPAPWYDPKAPESRNFAGLLVMEAKLSQPIDRRLVQNVGHGATLTRTRFRGRTLEVRGILIGKTCCATAYGLKWLTQALLGSYCDSCDDCDFSFLECCPSMGAESECLVMCDEETGLDIPYFRASDSELSEWQRGLDFMRQMHGVGLLEGPEVTGCATIGCGHCGCSTLTEVEFTLGIGNPWMFSEEKVIAKDSLLGGCSNPICTVTFVKDDTCDPTTVCPEPADCQSDPDCGDATPVAPPQGRMPVEDCGCLPLLVGRTCFDLEAGKDWFDRVLILEIKAGAKPIKNLAVRAWQNPMELSCCSPENASYFDDCNVCSTLMIKYIPAYGTLRFDSARRDVTLTCDGVTRPGAKSVSSIDGMPFQWLELGCQPMCLAIDTDCANTGNDATVSIWVAEREL